MNGKCLVKSNADAAAMSIHSGVSWLSSSNAEIARARQVLDSLTGGVIDELGFLVLQGAFADHFYPLVTTPMTRARYPIFIPALLQPNRLGL